MRKEVTVIVARIQGRMCIHFTDTKLQGEDLWFPLLGASEFNLIEYLLTAHGIAHNVVSLQTLRVGQGYRDIQVIYNTPEVVA